MWKIFFMICLQTLASTSSNVQDRRRAVLAHLQAGGGHAARVGGLGRAEGDACLPGMPSTASGVEGMFAPSHTTLQAVCGQAVLALASPFISFCVAQGSAMSHGTLQMPLQPSCILGGRHTP